MIVDQNQRDAELKRLVFDDGLTLREAGERYGIERERVRQIVGNVGRHRSVAYQRKIEQRQAERAAQFQKAKEKILRLYAEEELTINEIAAKTGLPKKGIIDLLKEHFGEMWQYQRHRRMPEKHISKDQVRVAIRSCAQTLGHVPTANEYRVWSAGKGPSGGAIVPGLYERWSDAIVDAGFPMPPGTIRTGIRRKDYMSYERCLAAINEVWDRLGRPPTAREYEQTAKESQGALPSMATVRNRAARRSWITAVQDAKEKRRRRHE